MSSFSEKNFLLTQQIGVRFKSTHVKWLIINPNELKNLNNFSSSIIFKVGFDLTFSPLPHNFYRILASHLPGFEHCTVKTVNRKVLENGAYIKIKGNKIPINLRRDPLADTL